MGRPKKEKEEKEDWFRTGVSPEPDPVTARQERFLAHCKDEVMEILTSEERCNAEIQGYGEWLGTLTKQEASGLISVLKGTATARKIVERKDEDVARRMGKKWYDTGGER